MTTSPRNDIRIGTLVNVGMRSPEYIKQILPHGFDSFCPTFWQSTAGIDWERLAARTAEVLDGSNAVISSLGIFGNPPGDEPKDRETIDGWRQCIDNAHRFGCSIVGGFTGRVRGVRLHESLPRFKAVWTDLARRARDKGVKIAFENCNMGGTWQSGDWNIAHNPTAWELMFDAVPFDNLGLEWEPCHQMVAPIDPMPQLRQWAPRIFYRVVPSKAPAVPELFSEDYCRSTGLALHEHHAHPRSLRDRPAPRKRPLHATVAASSGCNCA
jgi:sugar phosphate isomerase/epimerase